MAHVITKNLESFLLREREIDNMEAEIRREEMGEGEDHSALDNSLMNASAMDESTYKSLNLITNLKEVEDRRRTMQFFLFILVLVMVDLSNQAAVYGLLAYSCQDHTLDNCFTYL